MINKRDFILKNWFFETIYFTLPISSFPKNGELDDFDKICSLVNTHFSFGSKIVICACTNRK